MVRLVCACIGAIVVAACQPGPTAAPTAAASPAATGEAATAPAPVVPATWSVIQLPDAVGRWRANGVIAEPDGFVVYGSVGDVPAAWTSVAAQEWQSIALPGGGGGGMGIPSQAATSSAATVLLGAGTTERCAHPFGELLWRRAHGDPQWDAVPFDERFCAGGFPIIAARDDLFLVAGMGTGDQPFAWRSADGLGWQDAAAGLPFDLPPWALAATGDEFLELGRGAQTDARVTANGDVWTQVAAPPAPPAWSPVPPGMDPSALLDTEGGLLAVYGADDASRTSAWRRDLDGAWIDVPLPTQPGDIVSGGAVAGGRPYLFGSRDGVAFLLTSADLVTWTAVQIPAVGAIFGLASRQGRTVLVTATLDADGDQDRSIVLETDGLPGGP